MEERELEKEDRDDEIAKRRCGFDSNREMATLVAWAWALGKLASR